MTPGGYLAVPGQLVPHCKEFGEIFLGAPLESRRLMGIVNIKKILEVAWFQTA